MDELRGLPDSPLGIVKGLSDSPLDKLRGNALAAVLINESGLYCLVMRSEKPEANAFKRWVTAEVLPSIRKTGAYRILDLPQQQQIKIYSEFDLHKKVVQFLRNHHPAHLLVPGLGELQDTVQRRSSCYHKGYRGGQPDLLILNNHKSYNGFAIELKTPKGGRGGVRKTTGLPGSTGAKWIQNIGI